MRWQATLLGAAGAALLLTGCFTAQESGVCARLARRLCECGPAACEAALPLLAAAERIEGRAGRDGAAACRAQLTAPLRCAPKGAGS